MIYHLACSSQQFPLVLQHANSQAPGLLVWFRARKDSCVRSGPAAQDTWSTMPIINILCFFVSLKTDMRVRMSLTPLQ